MKEIDITLKKQPDYVGRFAAQGPTNLPSIKTRLQFKCPAGE